MAASGDAGIESTKNMESASNDVNNEEHYTQEQEDQMTRSEDVNAWKLPKKLAKTFMKNLGEHFTDEEIKTNILEDYPVAKNIPQVPSLDSTMETYLGSAKANYATVNDRSLFRILSKVRDIYGSYAIEPNKAQ